MLAQLNGDEISVNINRAKYEANELIVNIFNAMSLSGWLVYCVVNLNEA
jgi:hypothetical protein